jgi:hypothetical protein
MSESESMQVTIKEVVRTIVEAIRSLNQVPDHSLVQVTDGFWVKPIAVTAITDHDDGAVIYYGRTSLLVPLTVAEVVAKLGRAS